jgi:hypothetical protein
LQKSEEREKPDKSTIRRENYTPIFLMNIVIKILKMVANKILHTHTHTERAVSVPDHCNNANSALK